MRPSYRPIGVVVLLVAISQLLPVASALASPGSLDPSFGTGGVVEARYGDLFSQRYALPTTGLVQPDGKVVVVGQVEDRDLTPPGGYPPPVLLFAWRYLADGTPDSSFGEGGRWFGDLNGLDSPHAVAAAEQPDGAVLVAGYFTAASGYAQWALTRLTPGGQVDGSFGNAGVATLPISDSSASVAVAIDPTGRALVWVTCSGADCPGSYLLGLDSEGRLDPSFGSGGIVQIGGGSAEVGRIGFQYGSRILLTTPLWTTRLLPNGSLDSSFGVAGKVSGRLIGVLPNGTLRFRDDYGTRLAWEDGSAVFGASSPGDSTFGRNVELMDAAGRLLSLGTECADRPDYCQEPEDFVAARSDLDMRPDATFGSAGLSQVDVGWGRTRVVAAGLDLQGRVVAIGYRWADDVYVVVSRWLAGGTPGPAVDLTLAQQASPDQVRVGSPARFDVTVTNSGATRANGVVTTIVLPEGAGLASIDDSCWHAWGREYHCRRPSLSAGQPMTLTVVLTPTQPGPVTVWARVSGVEPDAVGGNNTQALTVVALPACTIVGDAHDNQIKGTAGNDVICGGAGNDTIDGKGGDDLIYGGDGNDTLVGWLGSDHLLGEAGDDLLIDVDGTGGNDSLDGGPGSDRCKKDAGDSVTSCP